MSPKNPDFPGEKPGSLSLAALKNMTRANQENVGAQALPGVTGHAKELGFTPPSPDIIAQNTISGSFRKGEGPSESNIGNVHQTLSDAIRDAQVDGSINPGKPLPQKMGITPVVGGYQVDFDGKVIGTLPKDPGSKDTQMLLEKNGYILLSPPPSPRPQISAEISGDTLSPATRAEFIRFQKEIADPSTWKGVPISDQANGLHAQGMLLAGKIRGESGGNIPGDIFDKLDKLRVNILDIAKRNTMDLAVAMLPHVTLKSLPSRSGGFEREQLSMSAPGKSEIILMGESRNCPFVSEAAIKTAYKNLIA